MIQTNRVNILNHNILVDTLYLIECFSIECSKTKTKWITTASEYNEKYRLKRGKTRENADDQVVTDVGFAFGWLRERREFGPITEQS